MSDIGNVPPLDFGMGDTGKVNGVLPAKIELKAARPITTEEFNDAEASIQDLQHSQYADSLEDWNIEMNKFLFQNIREAVSGMRKNAMQAEKLVKEISSGTLSDEDKVHHKKQVESLLKELNSIAENVEYDGNKLLTSDGKALPISVGDGEVLNIESRDLSFGVEHSSWSDAGDVLEKIVEEIRLIREYDGFLLGVSQKMEKATTLMEHELSVSISSQDFTKATELAINQARDMTKDGKFSTLAEFGLTDFAQYDPQGREVDKIHKMAGESENSLFEVQANIEPERVLNLTEEGTYK